MIKKIFSKILPREDKFYTLIGNLSDQAAQSAIHLKTFVEAQTSEQRTEALRLATSCRLEAKKLSAEVTKELCASFITPFDREDIQDFTLSLYKITKTIKKICDRLEMYGLRNENGDLSRQTDLITQEAQAMQNMVLELTSSHDSKRIISTVNLLHDLEKKGDDVLNELLASLFRDEQDIKKLILRKDVYDMLEKVIDRYRDVAAVALQIVLKHS